MTTISLINFDQAITELKDSISDEEDAREQRRLQRLVVKLEALKKIEQKSTRNKTDVKQAMNITCYKNIGYCCGLAKDCIMRDCCRQALGINDDTYARVKEKVVWDMLEIGEGVKLE